MRLKLTKTSVDALEITGSRYVVHDTALTGFQIRVNASGSKTAAVVYRKGGRILRHSLGKISEAYTFAMARRDAMEALIAIKAGGDPAADKRVVREAPTLEEVARRFMADHVAVFCKPRGYQAYEILLRIHVLPVLGRKKVVEITRADVEFLHRKVGATYQIAANRALTMLSSLFSKCEDWGLRPQRSNPVHGVKRFREQPRDRTLTPQERARLDDLLTEAEQAKRGTDGHLSLGHVAAIRLLILTGARRSEILTLTWPMVGFERGELRLPDSKTGAKTIPLSSQAAAYLQQLWQRREFARREADDEPSDPNQPDWVCATSKGKRLHTLNRAWLKLRKAAGLNDVVLHDLRRSAATDAFSAGVPRGLVGGVLGHASTATTARYALAVAGPKRHAALAMGDAIEASVQAGRAALAASPAAPEVITGRVEYIAVWGLDEQSTTERWFPTFEAAHAFVVNRKAEGCEIAYVDERPLSAIDEADAD